MKERLELLKREIKRLRDLTRHCDDELVGKLMDVHDAMARIVKQLEERLRTQGQ